MPELLIIWYHCTNIDNLHSRPPRGFHAFFGIFKNQTIDRINL